VKQTPPRNPAPAVIRLDRGVCTPSRQPHLPPARLLRPLLHLVTLWAHYLACLASSIIIVISFLRCSSACLRAFRARPGSMDARRLAMSAALQRTPSHNHPQQRHPHINPRPEPCINPPAFNFNNFTMPPTQQARRNRGPHKPSPPKRRNGKLTHPPPGHPNTTLDPTHGRHRQHPQLKDGCASPRASRPSPSSTSTTRNRTSSTAHLKSYATSRHI